MRKRRKKRYALRALLFLLAALAVGAVCYLYPAWRAAQVLRDKMNLPCSSFELEVELDRGKLPREQEKLLGTLAMLTGIREEAMYRLSIKGSTWEDRVHLTVCPEGEAEPLLELYLSDDMNVINETMLYNAIRGNLAGQSGLLGALMPEQKETLYMTLEQVGQIFGIELSGFRPAAADREFTATEYFLMLAVMARERQAEGWRFRLETDRIGLGFDVAEGGAVRMELQIRNPSELLDKGNRLPAGLRDRLPGEGLQGLKSLKSLSLILMPEEGGAIVMPGNLANQDIIDIITKIRSWFQETFGG